MFQLRARFRNRTSNSRSKPLEKLRQRVVALGGDINHVYCVASTGDLMVVLTLPDGAAVKVLDATLNDFEFDEGLSIARVLRPSEFADALTGRDALAKLHR